MFAAFPAVYAAFVAAPYILVLLLLFGLIFRGAACALLRHGSLSGCGTGVSTSAPLSRPSSRAPPSARSSAASRFKSIQYVGGAFEWRSCLISFGERRRNLQVSQDIQEARPRNLRRFLRAELFKNDQICAHSGMGGSLQKAPCHARPFLAQAPLEGLLFPLVKAYPSASLRPLRQPAKRS